MGRHMAKLFVSVFLFAAALTATAQPIVIDGQFTAAEWAAATNYSFSVNLPGGGTTSGQLYIANDRDNLYVCMRVKEPAISAAESFDIEMDANRSSVLDSGDDVLLLTVLKFLSPCEGLLRRSSLHRPTVFAGLDLRIQRHGLRRNDRRQRNRRQRRDLDDL